MSSQDISVHNAAGNRTSIDYYGIVIDSGGDATNDYHLQLSPSNISSRSNDSSHSLHFQLNSNGVKLEGGRDDEVLTSNGSTIYITEYAKKTELPAVPTKTSQLTNDSNFIAATTATRKVYEIDRGISLINGSFKVKNTDTVGGYSSFSSTNLDLSSGSARVIYGVNGIYSNQYRNCVLTTDNEFKSITDFASAEQLQSVKSGLSAKQNKITVNEVDVTDIETADITKLRTIVTNLINALSASNLIRETKTIE